MGCDIHLVLERKNDAGKWIGVQKMGYVPAKLLGLSSYTRFKLTERDYNFFYGLAGVRGGDEPARDPNGFPDDASKLSVMELGDDQDLHSHGFIGLPELIPIIAKRKYEQRELADDLGDAQATAVAATLEGRVSPTQIVNEWISDDIEPNQYGEYRLVFAFDN